MKHIIVSGGDADPEFVSGFLKEHPGAFIIAADSGLACLDAVGAKPDRILGDYDSANHKLVEKYLRDGTEVLTYRAEKDFTDTEAAVKSAVSDGSSGIFVLGAAGGRLDHFLANVQALRIPLKKGIPAEIADPQNRIRLIDGPAVLHRKTAFGKYVSLIPLTARATGVTLTGFRYPLEDAVLRQGTSVGVSNEIRSETARISFKTGILMLIMSKDRGEE